MTMSILHTGQTGVERGAYRAARASDLPVAGFCMLHGRDEFGPMPPEVRADLEELPRVGARTAAYATLQRANAIVIAVPDRSIPNEFTGVEALRREVRRLHVPCFIIDPGANLAEVAVELRRIEAQSGELRVMVTGPRRTRWAEGERLGWRLVTELVLSDALTGSRKRRVLVVDDDPPTGKAMSALVRALGHDCAVASDGAAALRSAAELPPDIAFVDIQLPDMTGYEVALRLRSRQTGPLFLAAITGWDGAADAVAAFEAGFDRHVRKPAPAELIQSLFTAADELLNPSA